MKKKINFCLFLLCVVCFFNSITAFATNTFIEPGSQYSITDFSKVGKGLYYDGTDFYYLLDTGIVATNYMYINDGDRFYFGDDGKMVKDEIVDHENEKYFFDPNGAMIKNRWVTYEELDPYDRTPTRTTYYFGPSGRAYKAGENGNLIVKTIDGEKYGFDSEGKRLMGYVSLEGEELESDETLAYAECAYYFDPDENGAALTGWLDYDGMIDSGTYPDTDEIYLYFDEKTARKVYYKGDQSDGYLHRTIDGQRYMFDANGVRFCKWYSSPSNPKFSPRYYSDDYDGFLAKGWFLAVPAKDSITEKNRKRNADDTEMWFYADSRGYLVRNCIKKIGRYTYCFDEDGVMQADAFVVVKSGKYVRSYDVVDMTYEQLVFGVDDGGLIGDGEFVMYFIDPENENLSGSMADKDRLIRIEMKDNDVDFIQNSTGGYSAEKSGDTIEKGKKLYQHGVLLKPLNEQKYGVARKSGDFYVVVNKNGVVQARSTVAKINSEEYLLVNEKGEFAGLYSCPIRIKNGQVSYKDDTVWVDLPVGELPPQMYWLDPTSYFINFKVYGGTVAPIGE